MSNEKDHIKWENFIEGIIDELKVFGAETVTEQEDVYLIAKTLLKLPKEVREKVLDEVWFIITDEVEGTIFRIDISTEVWRRLFAPLREEEGDSLVKLSALEEMLNKTNMKIPFIVLNFAAMREESEVDKMNTIAHEIAHFILGHDGYDPRERNMEKEADDLIEKWGFKRKYKSYEFR
jgi:hypothetical protein